jgi:putative ABC transport system permease protein
MLLRKILVVTQFSITVCLIIGSLIVMQQMRFMNKSDLGFNMDQMLIVKSPLLSYFDSSFVARVSSFKEELKKISSVKGAATSWTIPGGETGRSFNVRRADSASVDKFTIRHILVDFDFIPIYNIKLIAGRNFRPTDHDIDFKKLHNALLNSSAVRLLGFTSPEDAIGKSIMRYDKKWDVVGIVSDFHQKSLRYPMEPTMFIPAYGTGSQISVKISPVEVAKTIDAIKERYAAFFPGNLFDYFFLDEHYNRQYENDLLFEKVFSIFAAFAIFVACLGLFGLALHSTTQRTKEIGIRKVLGASISNILLLLTKDFARLVLIASIVAFPIAWWVMNRWLEDFSYRITIGWWIFLIAGSVAFVVALLTVSFQAFRASIANPVKSLRTE